MLKAAIIGCGKIADSHAAQIQRISGCEIVGVCDREPLMARQLQERYPIKAHYSDFEELLDKSRPDVVHITTPPQSHFSLAKRCIEAGVHVYVEKPFTLDAAEAEILIDLAEQRGVKITAGHDDQFSHVARRMRTLVQGGFLGTGPVHLESYYCYELSAAGYSGALLGDKNHWVRKLPGKLLHNIISHGIARIAEFAAGESVSINAEGFTSNLLKSRGETELIDELRVMMRDENGMTAYFVFSSQMRPALHQFRVYGQKNGLILDQDQETLVRLRGTHYTSYVEKFVPPVNFAKQYLANMRKNMGLFLARDFQMKAGMRYLIESFYRSIENGGPAPIPYREILLTARIMDGIFAQISAKQAADQGVLSLQSI